MTEPAIHAARGPELDAVTLYALLRLRTDVFVVEQACAYPELDGRDLLDGTTHWWVEGPDGAPLAGLRLLTEGPRHRIGRVVTAPAARGQGLAARLMAAALEVAPGEVVLDAQAYLEAWYGSFGFTRDGEPYVEDGIPHVPMRRPAPKG